MNLQGKSPLICIVADDVTPLMPLGCAKAHSFLWLMFVIFCFGDGNQGTMLVKGLARLLFSCIEISCVYHNVGRDASY